MQNILPIKEKKKTGLSCAVGKDCATPGDSGVCSTVCTEGVVADSACTCKAGGVPFEYGVCA